MNAAEVARLLGIASTLDNKISAGSTMQVRTWAHVLDDVPYSAAENALREHYRRSTDTVMPADIVESWRNARRENAERAHSDALRARAIEQRPEDLVRSIRSGVARVTAALAIARGADPEHVEAEAEARRVYLAVACPWCKARPGARCTGPGGKPLTKQPAHDARLAEAFTAAR